MGTGIDFGFKLEGFDRLTKNILALGPYGAEEMDQALNVGAKKVRDLAKFSIQRGARSGRLYRQSRKGSAMHQASAPGEPPKTWHGNLVAHISSEKSGKLEYNAGSRSPAPWGAWLELGTTHIRPRPWLAPAFKNARSFIQERLAQALKLALRRAFSGR